MILSSTIEKHFVLVTNISKEMRSSLLLSAFFCGLIQWIDAAGSVGNFRTYYHGIRGQVNILSPSQLSITNFQYDGQGPTDGTGRGTVYFWYGKNRKILFSKST